jgi:hypothetical protein
MRNNLKYKNKPTFLGKLRRRFHEVFNFRYEDVVVAKIEITLDSYKYLYRNLVKINQSFGKKLFITLSKSDYKGEFGYYAVISLKVIR